LLVLGCLGFAAGWSLYAGMQQAQVAWMAPLAALDAALMLRIGRMQGGWGRATWALVGTVATVLLANWGIAAVEIGRSMGLLPWDSLLKLGPAYASELTRLANGGVELAWYAVAAAVAVIAGR
jgi:hypothetical protein